MEMKWYLSLYFIKVQWNDEVTSTIYKDEVGQDEYI